MTDRPIIFSAPMIRALIDGRKTQTRRLIKDRGFPPEYCGGRYDDRNDPEAWGWEDHDRGEWITLDKFRHYRFVPYAPGDRLWVREAFWECDDCSHINHVEGANSAGIGDRKCCASCDAMLPKPKKSPIHMPRRVSRLTLTVTDVRVQRVQDISRGDAMDEGCPFANMADGPSPRDWFRHLWNSIHGPDAWDRNDWVAAYTFTVHRQNIDQMGGDAPEPIQ
ncbi:hypothetical protein [Roseovarius sp. D0-M9]|uniref:hypothetical protein n=1 Tax=Roseovarius sp. D0-M9 TaxID=3127117 RepID=UPI00301033A2